MRRLLVAILAIASLANAQSGEWGSRGISHRFVVRGQRVFAADGRGVAVYDVSQTPVRRLAVAETGGESLDLAFISDSDLAVVTRSGIERFSVQSDGTLIEVANDPNAIATRIASNGRYLAGATANGVTIWQPDMTFVAQLSLAQPASALAWHGETMIAAAPGLGVYLFDIAGGASVVIPELARDITIVGDTLYIAGGVDGIVEYDLTNEAAPRLLSRTAAGEKNFVRIAIGDGRLIAAEIPDAIDVFDISSGVPVLSARFNEPVETIAASGMRLFAAGTSFDRFGLPTETGAPIRVFDASVASSPRLTSEFRDLAGPLSGVATNGSLAYIIDRPYFRIIDVSSTASPRELSSLLIDNIGDRVKVQGSLVLLFGRGQVQVIDVSNPYAPRLIKGWEAQGGPPSNAAFMRDMFVEANPYSGFHVVDFTNFPNAEQIGGIKGHYYDTISNGGDIVYVSQDGVALVTVDVANVHDPQPLNSVVVGPVRADIARATANHPELLVVQTRSGLRVYSLANPRAPVEASFTPSATIHEIAADGDLTYLAIPGSVQRMDSSDPARPAFSPTAMQPLAPMQVAAANGKVVIADRYSLRVYGPNTPPPPAPPPARRRATRR